MKTKNHLRVDKFRKLGGNTNYSEKYHALRSKYDIEPKQANIMKYWSVNKIKIYLEENKIFPTEDYLTSLKEADRL